MWAGRDSDEEDNKRGFGASKSKDYAAPVSFVSSGVQEDSRLDATPQHSESDVQRSSSKSKVGYSTFKVVFSRRRDAVFCYFYMTHFNRFSL